MEEANQSLGEPLQEYFGSIGVKTMQDFTLLTVSAFVQRQLASALTPVSTAQEADINAIPGLDKFAKGRLMRGLQSIVPNFLVEPYHNPKPAPAAQRSQGPADAGERAIVNEPSLRVTSYRCTVERWLAAARLTQYKSKIKSMGIKCVSDFAEMEVSSTSMPCLSNATVPATRTRILKQ